MNKSDQYLALFYKVADFSFFLLSFYMVRTNLGDGLELGKYDLGVFLLFILFWQVIAYRNKLYFIHLHNKHFYRFRNLLKSHFIFMVGVSMTVVLFDFPAYTREVVAGILVMNLLASFLGNLVLAISIRMFRKKGVTSGGYW